MFPYARAGDSVPYLAPTILPHIPPTLGPLSADPQITEGIKWNAPSFYCKGWFATANVRGKDSVMVVFHMGAKVKDNSTAGATIEDTSGLLEWAAKERALARFSGVEDFNAKQPAFKAVVTQWVRQMK